MFSLMHLRVLHHIRIPVAVISTGLHVIFLLALPWLHAHLEEEHGAHVVHAHDIAPTDGGSGDVTIHEGTELAEAHFSALFHSGVALSTSATSRLADPPARVLHSAHPAHLQYPFILDLPSVVYIGPVCPLKPLSSGERARFLGTDLSPPAV